MHRYRRYNFAKVSVILTLLICAQFSIITKSSNQTKYIDENFESSPQQRYLPPGSKLFWPNKTIPYQIDSVFNRSETNKIANAIQWWNTKTCVRWVKRNRTESDFVNITRDGVNRCRSYVGRIGGAQKLTLPPYCFESDRHVFHEMMHASGFIHEHQRPDRDNFVIHWQNIEPECKKYFNKTLDKRKFYDGYELPYDIHSVMHYTERQCTINPKLKSIEAKNKKRLDCTNIRSCYPTVLDIKKINTIYGCMRNNTN